MEIANAQTAATNVESMWYCTVCKKNYRVAMKGRHLNSRVHDKAAIVARNLEAWVEMEAWERSIYPAAASGVAAASARGEP